MATAMGNLTFDPFDGATIFDPHPLFRRLREEAPLYHDEVGGFYALSRYHDVEQTLLDTHTFSSRFGVTLDLLRGGYEIPPGTLIFEDPPVHTLHRRLLSRMFTARRVSSLEPMIREVCVQQLEPFVSGDSFDFVAELGAILPMQVIGMLIGIPEGDQKAIRDHFHGARGSETQSSVLVGDIFAEYIDWRIEHPSDDVMTTLLNAEFEDSDGSTRRLTREELLAYVNIVAAAGNETTMRLIGWTGDLLGKNADERRRVAEDLSLIPAAIEEVLRYEPSALMDCRYVNGDTEFYGETVPAGSSICLLIPSANRDRPDDPDRFSVERPRSQHFTFGFGAHYCLGQALARLEASIALEEVLKRFPDWQVDYENAVFGPIPDMRGWESLPVTLG